MRQETTIPIAPGATMRVTVDDGDYTARLQKFIDRISDWRPFWLTYWAPEFFSQIHKNFAGQGRLVGGWRALSPEYAAWKFRKYGRQPILVATGAMRESFSVGGRNNVFRPGRTKVIAGSADRKVKYHQRGTSRMPRRPVVLNLPSRTMQRLLSKYMRTELQAAKLAS
jgi:phage gpG-like protein